MAYINTKSKQYPISEQDIRNEFPNTSFPVPFQAPEDYAPVLISPVPEYNTILQIVREGAPELFTKVNEQTQEEYSFYMQTWEVVDKFTEYTDSEGNVITKAEQEAAAITLDEESKKNVVKQQAMRLLQETDWVEVPSVSDTTKIPHLGNFSEFMDYRLALRTIAVNPPVSVEEYPVLPTETWVTE